MFQLRGGSRQNSADSNALGGAQKKTGVRKLGGRQRDIVMAIARGLTNKEVADELGLSPHTVRAHVRLLFARYGVSTRAGLVYVCRGALDAEAG